ncbi:MAG: tRNA (adenosine(37)-N6)-threonylcarbamoyltransferase complex ATPase subunit type 1 TsaE [Rickettsiales bacterium]|jgi:tRNA threonylcarbamoyl adenosine modification protein YjeE|nr:tRNA (adenosine(37)-N6)-threonylcarbamoyltransferase complex ATPase subunit type 1 TsaE [Rickettsiales bacterium]
MLKNNKIIIRNQEEMENFAKNIAFKISENAIFMLFGTLGVGKTFFAKSLIRALLNEELEVPSPTFNLIYQYSNPKERIKNIFHFDLYRLYQSKTANLNIYQELENIGLFSALKQGLSIIEWPEIAESTVQESCYKLYFSFNNEDLDDENTRKITCNDEFVKKFL